MVTHSPGIRAKSWFSQTGPDFDVVVSSRVLFHRSLSGYLFGTDTTPEELLDIRKNVESVVSQLSEDYECADSDVLSAEVRSFLLARGLLPGDTESGLAFLRSDDLISIWVGGAEHLRINGFAGGLDLHRALDQARAVDSELENLLEYAVSLHFGYLTSQIDFVGTGLFATTLVHLPALDKSEMIEAVAHQMAENDCSLKELGNPAKAASLYAVERRGRMGESEDDVVTKLAESVGALVHYERTARRELVNELGRDFKESVYRTFGTLRYARVLEEEESLQLTSLLRLGISLDVFDDLSLLTATEMLFLSQSSQASLLLNAAKGGETDETDDEARAALMRCLIDRELNEGDTCLRG